MHMELRHITMICSRREAIKKLFGEHAYEMKVNSTKSMVGHLLGRCRGCGIYYLRERDSGQIYSCNGGIYDTGRGNGLDYVAGDGVEEDLEYALSNSLGFGGHNASILVKKWGE